jgi:hypothetical protein
MVTLRQALIWNPKFLDKSNEMFRLRKRLNLGKVSLTWAKLGAQWERFLELLGTCRKGGTQRYERWPFDNASFNARKVATKPTR